MALRSAWRRFYGVQRVDSAGTPRASVSAEKVVLDTTDETVLYDVVSARGFSSVNGEGFTVQGYVLGMSEALVNGGGVWVHSREKGSGSIRVSSQQMKVVSEVLGLYQTYQAMVESAKSYGGINGSVAYLKPVTLAGISAASQSGGSGSQSGGGGGSQSTGGSGSGSSSTGGSSTGGSGGSGSQSGGSSNQNANENQNSGGSSSGGSSESGGSGSGGGDGGDSGSGYSFG